MLQGVSSSFSPRICLKWTVFLEETTQLCDSLAFNAIQSVWYKIVLSWPRCRLNNTLYIFINSSFTVSQILSHLMFFLLQTVYSKNCSYSVILNRTKKDNLIRTAEQLLREEWSYTQWLEINVFFLPNIKILKVVFFQWNLLYIIMENKRPLKLH